MQCMALPAVRPESPLSRWLPQEEGLSGSAGNRPVDANGHCQHRSSGLNRL